MPEPNIPVISDGVETRTALSKIREVAHSVFHGKQPCTSLMVPPYKWWGIQPGHGPPPPLADSGCDFESLASHGRVAPVFICTPPSWTPLSGTLRLLPRTLARLLASDGIECSLASEYAIVDTHLASGALAVISLGDTLEEKAALELAATEGKHAVLVQSEGMSGGINQPPRDDVSRVFLPWIEEGAEDSVREVRWRQ